MKIRLVIPMARWWSCIKNDRKYKSHPSIKLIKTNNENNVSFRFHEIQAIEIKRELKNLDCSKAS